MPERAVKGWVWPRDTRPGRGWLKNRMSALYDIASGQGPDVFIGRLEHRPKRATWSRWGQVFGDSPPNEEIVPNPFFNTDRENQVYDFRSRRYRPWTGDPTSSMWSDVKRCPNKWARMPVYYRDALGFYNDFSDHHRDPMWGEPTCWRKYH